MTVEREIEPGVWPGFELPDLEGVLSAAGTNGAEVSRLAPAARGALPTAGELIGAALAASAARLVGHLATVAVAEDVEAIHQARVGIRRLRSDLKTVRPLLDYRSVRPWRDELDWLMDRLGEVRDLDVLLARLHRDSRAITEDDRGGVEAVIARAREDRAQAYERLRAALRTSRCAALLEDTARMAAAPPFRSGRATLPAAKVLPQLVRRPLRELRQEVRRQGAHPDDHGLHRIRIAAKRVRYAAELAAPAAGKKARRAARGLARVQTVLGEHNDAVVAVERLRDLGARTGGAGAWAAGLLAGLQLARAAERRERFPSAWAEAAAGKRWRWTKS